MILSQKIYIIAFTSDHPNHTSEKQKQKSNTTPFVLRTIYIIDLFIHHHVFFIEFNKYNNNSCTSNKNCSRSYLLLHISRTSRALDRLSFMLYCLLQNIIHVVQKPLYNNHPQNAINYQSSPSNTFRRWPRHGRKLNIY
ncbi:unnamed protein product [Rotaria sordida]|uniref:Uncharacterized protein n=1 Tax=Rotaria sordida TaxID=392033 RepID=A0A815TKV3_9BILA|nr:unnamed protein product [Rotaria sordida]